MLPAILGRSPHLKGALLAGTGACLLIPDATLIRLADAPDAEIIFWRGMFTALAFGAVVAARHRPRTIAVTRSIGRVGIVVGVLWSLTTILFIYAVNHTAVANALVILSTAPLFAALFSHVVLGERLSRRTWIAIAVVFAGVLVTFGSAIRIDGVSGAVAALAVAGVVGLNLTLTRRSAAVDMLPALALGGVLSLLAMGVVAWPPLISAQDAFVIGLAGGVLSPAALALVTLGTRFLSSPEVSLLLLIETAMGPLFAWAVLNEAPPALAVAGGVIILGALAGNSWSAMRQGRT